MQNIQDLHALPANLNRKEKAKILNLWVFLNIEEAPPDRVQQSHPANGLAYG